MSELSERELLIQEIVAEIEASLGEIHPSDLADLCFLLRTPGMKPENIRELHKYGLLLSTVKGLAYDRLMLGQK